MKKFMRECPCWNFDVGSTKFMRRILEKRERARNRKNERAGRENQEKRERDEREYY